MTQHELIDQSQKELNMSIDQLTNDQNQKEQITQHIRESKLSQSQSIEMRQSGSTKLFDESNNDQQQSHKESMTKGKSISDYIKMHGLNDKNYQRHNEGTLHLGEVQIIGICTQSQSIEHIYKNYQFISTRDKSDELPSNNKKKLTTKKLIEHRKMNSVIRIYDQNQREIGKLEQGIAMMISPLIDSDILEIQVFQKDQHL